MFRFTNNSDSGFTHGLSSEITAEQLYSNRRQWLLQASAACAGLGGVGAITGGAWAQNTAARPLAAVASKIAGASVPDRVTSFNDATRYNNFYEFGTDKSEPAVNAVNFNTQGWRVSVEGLVSKKLVLDLDDLLKLAPLEERIYRLRCVEGWSMVIPWIGYSLSALIQRAKPLGSAKYLEFTTLADPQQMVGVRSRVLDWPYIEGLRMDEAMHPLTLLSLGMYGQVLPNQNGAPVRLVVPWKYGFKSAKSLVKIRFVESQPVNSWGRSAPREYGFYSNVNPMVDHPRWSQASERRIGEDGLFARKRKTLMFNGYEAQVGQLYAGMDLTKFF
jgi:methionine sulfoxide reductase catalytic subunit